MQIGQRIRVTSVADAIDTTDGTKVLFSLGDEGEVIAVAENVRVMRVRFDRQALPTVGNGEWWMPMHGYAEVI